MEWVETTGRTLEEAKEAALDELGVDEHDAEFEILQEPKLGLFGRLRSEGRVRARVRPTAPRPKEDRRDRRRRNGRTSGTPSTSAEASSGDDGGDIATLAADTETETETTPANGAASSAGNERAGGPSRGTPAGSSANEDGGSAALSEEAGQHRTSRRSRRGGQGARAAATSAPDPAERPRREGDQTGQPDRHERGRAIVRGGGNAAEGRQVGAEDDEDRRGDEREGIKVDVALEEQGRVAREFLEGLVREFDLPVSIAVAQPDEETLDINLSGDDLGLLIGPKGATLLAIQDLTRTVVQRRTGATNGRISVDVGGYRQKRADALIRFTQKVASDVKASGMRTTLEPMSAADRKIVHDTITDIDGVATISEGEEPRRRVVVLPEGS
jgi:spoIIIJ-associated protein